jgi:hypothetical protein
MPGDSQELEIGPPKTALRKFLAQGGFQLCPYAQYQQRRAGQSGSFLEKRTLVTIKIVATDACWYCAKS